MKFFMRTLNVIDLTGQTLILGSMLITQVIGLVRGDTAIVMSACIYAAFFIGWWQMISAIIMIKADKKSYQLRLIHIASAAGYFICYGIFSQFNMELNVVVTVFAVLGISIPAILAVFYYVVTVKTFISLKTYSLLKLFLPTSFAKY